MSGALTWREAGRRCARPLERERPVSIGRADRADIRLDESSVSREQALIRYDGRGYLIANRSRTNPTRVNGQIAAQEVSLHDQDELLVGSLRLRFHDLATHDAISGPVCSHCLRENSATDQDCWFCGTSLVSAASTLRQRRVVVGRLIGEDGQFADLYDGQSALLAGTSPVLSGPARADSEAPAVTAVEGRLVLTTGGRAKVNYAAAMPAQPLATGDVIEAEGTSYLVLVR